MNAEQVRIALEEYIELYDEPNLRIMSNKMNTNYNNLASFRTKKKTLGESSLRKIANYIKQAADKQAKLDQIINQLPFE